MEECNLWQSSAICAIKQPLQGAAGEAEWGHCLVTLSNLVKVKVESESGVPAW